MNQEQITLETFADVYEAMTVHHTTNNEASVVHVGNHPEHGLIVLAQSAFDKGASMICDSFRFVEG